MPTCRGSDPAAVRTRQLKAGASALSRSRRWRRAAIARRASRSLLLDIHRLLHRNNYKIKVDQFYSLIKLNNSFNF
ncbi:hypothetical protein BVIET440_60055 [Burkholderia vietnamiensis]